MAKKENVKEKKEKKQKSHYFKDMKAELKKVIWPTPKQLLNNTIAVIAFTLIAAAIVFVLDICFESINKYGIVPMQEKIQTSYQASHQESETTDNTSENEKANIDTETTDENNSVEAEVEIEADGSNEDSNESSQE